MIKKNKFTALFLGTTLLYPIIIFQCFLLSNISNKITFLKELIALFIFVTVVGIITIVVNKKIRKRLYYISYILISIIIFIKISFIIRYKTTLNASAFYIIFETNYSESKQFLANYFTNQTLLIFLLISLPLFFLYKKINYSLYHFKPSCKIRYLYLLLLPGCFYVLNKKFDKQDLFISAYNNYIEYKQFKKNKKQQLASKLNNKIICTKTSNAQQTNIVIIGESLSNWHMQLYGYERNTNPLLSKIKEELLVFKNVISPHAHTQVSINKIFTLADFKNNNPADNSSIVQLANSGGYQTFWISNQPPIGLNETLPTVISNAANYSKFIATDNDYYTLHDEKLFPHIDTALAHKAKLKTIFIHLIGNHIRYNLRYPKAFSFYNNKIPNNKNKAAHKYINYYDNSVLYNDYVVYTIIQKLKKQHINSTLIYFSDHGDDVYDTLNFRGHSEYEATKPMFEIPFIIWRSKKFKENHSDQIIDNTILNRKYILEDFYHSFSKIIDVDFKGYDSTKDILSADFKPKVRYIKNGINYDKK